MSEPEDLDLLLDIWARQHRLPRQRSAAIHHAIVTPQAPSVDWWQNFTSHVAGIVAWASGPPAGMRPQHSVVLTR